MKRMEWEKLLSSKRFKIENTTISEETTRSPFDADVDKLIFSSSFRRLSRKTQVHPLACNDHVHTRLTHSLEVARVGKALGTDLGNRIKNKLPDNISPSDIGTVVEAACLAHDLGNPPFGHAGEESMSHWFEVNGPIIFKSLSKDHKRDLISIEGNAQGFRNLTQTENHLFDGGLRLTYATLGSFLKYPWSSRKPGKKFGAYITEEKILAEIAKEIGLINKSKHVWCRHPLAYLVEAADDICYGIIDLEDAIELRILSFDEVSELFLKYFDKEKQNKIKEGFSSKEAFRVNLSRLRDPVFDFLIKGAVDGFIEGYESIMKGELEGDVFEQLGSDSGPKKLIAEAKQLSEEQIFKDPKKVEIELGSYAAFETLLEAFCEAALEQANHLKSPKGEILVGWKSTLLLKLLSDHAPNEINSPPDTSWSSYQCLRRVVDFVSGMTDNYATYIAKQLNGMGFSGIQRP